MDNAELHARIYVLEEVEQAQAREIIRLTDERDRLGEALEKERSRTCRDCGRQLGDPVLQTCSACTRNRLKALYDGVMKHG